MATSAHQAIHELDGLSDRALDHLAEELFDLPALDLSLLVTLPKLIGPDFEHSAKPIEHDDPDWGWDALTNVHKQTDTPQQRARLAEAIVRLRDQNRIGRQQAAFALLNLHSNSNRFRIAVSLPQQSRRRLPASNEPRPASRSPPNLSVYPGQGEWSDGRAH